MIEQLKELLEMQKALDEALMKEHGKTEYPLEETKIALFVELGEMMNELQTEFKWWKKHATYNREKALVIGACLGAVLMAVIVGGTNEEKK